MPFVVIVASIAFFIVAIVVVAVTVTVINDDSNDSNDDNGKENDGNGTKQMQYNHHSCSKRLVLFLREQIQKCLLLLLLLSRSTLRACLRAWSSHCLSRATLLPSQPWTQPGPSLTYIHRHTLGILLRTVIS